MDRLQDLPAVVVAAVIVAVEFVVIVVAAVVVVIVAVVAIAVALVVKKESCSLKQKNVFRTPSYYTRQCKCKLRQQYSQLVWKGKIFFYFFNRCSS